jgi:hypothetical protein
VGLEGASLAAGRVVARGLAPAVGIRGSALALALTLCAGGALAQEAESGGSKPAVDSFSYRFQSAGGGRDSGFTRSDRKTFDGGVQGTFVAPIGQRFGFRGDAVGADSGDGKVLGLAGHVFARDPGVYKVGLYGSSLWLDDGPLLSKHTVGLTGETYWNKAVLSGFLGVDFSRGRNASLGGGLRGKARSGAEFNDKFDVGYYFTDDLKVSVGHRYGGRTHSAALGVEGLLPVGLEPLVSGFTEARLGEGGYKSILAGVRVYFGGNDGGTLLSRHMDVGDGPTSSALSEDALTGPTKGSIRSESRRSSHGYPTDPDGPTPCSCSTGED